ncbi:CD151 antigen-like isoform X2 [Periplaneta americana]|uniref:CD151 antigen-like isoform X2 n=1 Tax=Periplaneta americana TaxID=6978 RepID=UPI0037E72774
MACGLATVKCSVMLLNLALVLMSLGLILVGATTLSCILFYYSNLRSKKLLALSVISILVFGLLAFILAFYGCYGVVKEKRCSLLTYVVVLVLVAVLQAVAGVLVFVKAECCCESVVIKGLTPVFEGYAKGNGRVDKKFECCGINGSTYWKEAIPKSCCRSAKAPCKHANDTGVYKEGCAAKMAAAINLVGLVIGGISIAMGIVEVACVILTIYLARKLKVRRRLFLDNERKLTAEILAV